MYVLVLTLPRSASSTAHPSPSSSSLPVYRGSCRWTQEATFHRRTTASPPTGGQTGGQRETGEAGERDTICFSLILNCWNISR